MSEPENPFADRRIPSAVDFQLPSDWQPSAYQPVPPQRCGARNQSGEQCKKWAIPGTGLNGTKPVCTKHGASLPQVKKAAEERVRIARLRIMDAAEGAFETIDFLSKNATQENVRLAAARDLLDRAGVKSGADITIAHEHSISPSSVLAEKLAGMAKSITAEREKEFTAAQESDIIDVEVIPEEQSADSSTDLTNE